MNALRRSSVSSCPDLPIPRSKRSSESPRRFSMDCNFPEMLAHDLEMSGAAFTSKRMTAGAPLLPTLAATDRARQPPPPLSTGHGPLPSDPAAQYYHLLATIRSLDAIEEWGSKLEEEGASEPESPGESPVRDGGQSSDSASEYSVGLGPPSVRPRQQSSATTAPTSIASRRRSSPPPPPPPLNSFLQPEQPLERNMAKLGSWVDLDSDDDADVCSYENNVERGLDPPSPCHGRGVKNIRSPSAPGVYGLFHLPDADNAAERPNTSSSFPSRDKPPFADAPPPIPTLSPRRWSSLGHRPRPFAHTDPSESSDSSINTGITPCRQPANDEPKDPSSPSSMTRATTCTSGRTIVDASISPDECSQPQKKLFHVQESRQRERRPDEQPRQDKHEQSASHHHPLAPREPHSSPHPPDPHPRPSLGHVHNWLEETTSKKTELSPLVGRHIEHYAPGIPPPPEVIDTLRISIVCFPETTLLSSSLTIETIRNYSKKFKNHGNGNGNCDVPDGESIFSSPTAATDGQRLWKKLPGLLSRRVASLSPSASASRGFGWTRQVAAPMPPSPSCTRTDAAAPDWSSLKTIFPGSSDYLCDALYAHLVAYNYITSLCRPAPPTTQGPEKVTSHDPDEQSRPEKESGPIPKKAAHLLGLSGMTGFATATPAPDNVNGSGSGRGSPAATSFDPSLRELQGGLGRCIARLVATLKLTASPAAGEDPSTMVREDVVGETMDSLLLRALCELVRRSEETR